MFSKLLKTAPGTMWLKIMSVYFPSATSFYKFRRILATLYLRSKANDNVIQLSYNKTEKTFLSKKFNMNSTQKVKFLNLSSKPKLEKVSLT